MSAILLPKHNIGIAKGGVMHECDWLFRFLPVIGYLQTESQSNTILLITKSLLFIKIMTFGHPPVHRPDAPNLLINLLINNTC